MRLNQWACAPSYLPIFLKNPNRPWFIELNTALATYVRTLVEMGFHTPNRSVRTSRKLIRRPFVLPHNGSILSHWNHRKTFLAKHIIHAPNSPCYSWSLGKKIILGLNSSLFIVFYLALKSYLKNIFASAIVKGEIWIFFEFNFMFWSLWLHIFIMNMNQKGLHIIQSLCFWKAFT